MEFKYLKSYLTDKLNREIETERDSFPNDEEFINRDNVHLV